MGKVYLITSPSGKQYVGLTIQKILNDRLKGHLKKSSNCTLLKRAIEKYGWDNMKVEVLIECDDEQVEYYEKLFIAGYRTQAPLGYNCTSGGEGGKKLCDETKENIRKGVVEKNKENGKLGRVKKINDKFKASCTYKCVEYQLGTYGTEEDAKKVVDEFHKDPENWTRPPQMKRKHGTGSIQYVRKSGKYQANTPSTNKKRTSLGRFDTYEKAEEVLDKYLVDNKLI